MPTKTRKAQAVTVRTLKAILGAFNRHDLDAIMEFFADAAMSDTDSSRAMICAATGAHNGGVDQHSDRQSSGSAGWPSPTFSSAQKVFIPATALCSNPNPARLR